MFPPARPPSAGQAPGRPKYTAGLPRVAGMARTHTVHHSPEVI